MSSREFPYVFSVEAVTVTEVTVFRIPLPSSVFTKMTQLQI